MTKTLRTTASPVAGRRMVTGYRPAFRGACHSQVFGPVWVTSEAARRRYAPGPSAASTSRFIRSAGRATGRAVARDLAPRERCARTALSPSLFCAEVFARLRPVGLAAAGLFFLVAGA